MNATAFWIEEPGKGALITTPLPDPGPDDVRVRTRFSGISRGTETLVFRGGVPKSQWAAMRCPFQEGDFPAPLKYGYSSVGVVETGPLEGRAVFCLHPHQDRYVVPATAVTPLPEGLPLERAVLAANLETAINGTWDGGLGVGDRVTVVGGGVVGLAVARLAATTPGVEVEVVEVNPARRGVVESLGATFLSPEEASPERDLVFHASATDAGLATALRLAGVEATVVELSWYGDRAVSAPFGEAFHSRRLTLRSSQVGRVPTARAPRWTYGRRLALALEVLAADAAYDALLEGESPFSALPETLARLVEQPALCHRVRYD